MQAVTKSIIIVKGGAEAEICSDMMERVAEVEIDVEGENNGKL